ncbi:MAG: EamA family transporter [Pseudolabrys sp.]
MEPLVFAAVLFAAACHAGWNAVAKIGLEPLATMTLITLGAGVVALPLLVLFGAPAAASWPWLVASVIVHLVYFAALTEAYRAGDLGQVYPLARGAAPLMTASLSPLFVGELLGLIAWAGVTLLATGVLLLSFRGGRDLARVDRRAVGFALLTAVTICAYSIVDGIGARLSENARGYSSWMFLGNALVMIAYAVMRLGGGVITDMARFWRRGLAAGAMQFLSYSIALWAMTVAPIALVAALRETSVLFGAAIAVVFLGEPLRIARAAAAALIVIGLVAIRYQ